jgi:hypothetical protein
MTDLDRALSVARTWENEAIAKGTRSTAASRRRLATIITALTEAQERERRVRTLANQVPARTSLGWLAEKFLVALGEPRSGNQPEVHMQWKGTDVCLDFQCFCSDPDDAYEFHLDGYVFGRFTCPRCGTTWRLGQPLIESEPAEQTAELPPAARLFVDPLAKGH